jgi:uncharacterized protein (UPF0332 family)
MKLNDLESQGLIERVEPNLTKVKKALERTQKDLSTARATLNIDEEWAYTIAYHTMLRAGRALMFYLEYRPKGKDQHKTGFQLAQNCHFEILLTIGIFQTEEIEKIRIAKNKVRRKFILFS